MKGRILLLLLCVPALASYSMVSEFVFHAGPNGPAALNYVFVGQ
jgi:hypothetical protein